MHYTNDISPDNNEDQAFPTLSLDPEKYREHLADLEITDEQANEFLQVLWNIMHTIVDIGWGLDSVQMFIPPEAEKAGNDSGNGVEQRDTKHQEGKASFNGAAATSKKEL